MTVTRSRYGELCRGEPPGLVGPGREVLYPQAQGLLICADGGGSNGYRLRLWKVEVA